ncbi:MAG: DUF4785 domain-containing protein [bacterium]
MKTFIHAILLCSTTLSLTSVFASETQVLTLLPTSPHDLSVHKLNKLTETQNKSFTNFEKQTLSYSYKATGKDKSTPLMKAYQSESKSWYLDASSTELAKGVKLGALNPGAVVRLSLAGKSQKSAKLSANEFNLTLNGQDMILEQTLDQIADTGRLQNDAWFSNDTLAFRFSKDAAPGNYTLQLNSGQQNSAQQWVINVLDRNSPYTLISRIKQQAFVDNDDISITTQFSDKALKSAQYQGFLIAPDGSPGKDIYFNKTNSGLYEAHFSAQSANIPGLWEVQILSNAQSNHGKLFRDTRIAFSIAAANAQLTGKTFLLDQRAEHKGLQFNFDMNVAQSSRYQISAQLTDKNGFIIATAESAAVLKTGQQTLSLNFSQQNLGKIDGPLFLKNLVIKDQASLTVLHSQFNALSIRNF